MSGLLLATLISVLPLCAGIHQDSQPLEFDVTIPFILESHETLPPVWWHPRFGSEIPTRGLGPDGWRQSGYLRLSQAYVARILRTMIGWSDLPPPTHVSVVRAGHRALPGMLGDSQVLWRFDYEGVVIQPKSWTPLPPGGASRTGPAVDARTRNITIFVNPNEPHFAPQWPLRIEIRDPNKERTFPPEPSSTSAAVQRSELTREVWSRPKDSYPRLSLVDALDAIADQSFAASQVQCAACIVANYVDWTMPGDDATNRPLSQPVWSIDLRSDELLLKPDTVTTSRSTYRTRHIIAMDGRLLGVLPSPRPDYPRRPLRIDPGVPQTTPMGKLAGSQ